MAILLLTAILEITILIFQFGQLLHDGSTPYCLNGGIPTWPNLSCNPAVLMSIGINWFFALIYLYWCAVAYEHWWLGSKDA